MANCIRHDKMKVNKVDYTISSNFSIILPIRPTRLEAMLLSYIFVLYRSMYLQRSLPARNLAHDAGKCRKLPL